MSLTRSTSLNRKRYSLNRSSILGFDDILPPVKPVVQIVNPPRLKVTTLYDRDVHAALRPMLTRGVYGKEADCLELLELITDPAADPAIATPGSECAECRTAGTQCIAAVKDDPFPTVVSRCINCTASDKQCDLPLRSHRPLCVCDWLMIPDDRCEVYAYHKVARKHATQISLPFEKRDYALAQKIHDKLRDRRQWFDDRIHFAYVSDRREIARAPSILHLERNDLFRPDACWVIPPKHQWKVCPCYPHRMCRESRHAASCHSKRHPGQH